MLPLFRDFILSHTAQIYVGIAILLLALLSIAIIVSKKRDRVNKRINLALKPYIQKELRNIVFPDGIGGLVNIEHIVLLKQGILVIETYSISGNLFGGDKIDQWTQMINGKSFKFNNPLYRIQILGQAIQTIAPNTPIFHRVIFTDENASFPKGKPGNVSLLDLLKEDLKALKQAPVMTEKQQDSWDRILRIARKDGQAIQQATING